MHWSEFRNDPSRACRRKESWRSYWFGSQPGSSRRLDIDIKIERDKKNLLEVKQEIEQELTDLRSNSFTIIEVELAMYRFSIDSNKQIEDYVTSVKMRNPREDLMKRVKYKYLTFDQKLCIYTYHKEGESISKLCKKFGILISTIKKFIKAFQTNPSRSKLIRSVRWK